MKLVNKSINQQLLRNGQLRLERQEQGLDEASENLLIGSCDRSSCLFPRFRFKDQ